MMRRFAVLPAALALAASACGAADPGEEGRSAPPASSPAAALPARFGDMSLQFIENRGQIDGPAAYYLKGRDKTLYFGPEGLTFALRGQEAAAARWAVKLDFLHARADARPSGRAPTGAVVSYFKGPKERWKTGIPAYAEIVYPELWPGVDLVYTGTAGRLKYAFVVRPGADPAAIRLAYRGASEVRLDDAGRLHVETPLGGFEDEAPYTYQDIGGARVSVESRYSLDPPAEDGTVGYGFQLGAYDPREPLVVDPAVLIYSGFIGGEGVEYGDGIAVGPDGSAYVTGRAESDESSFPVAAGPDTTYNGGAADAFVARVSPDGRSLIYAGYIGGSESDWGRDVAVDVLGNAYIVGETQSDETTFPVTVGPDLTYGGGADAFVAKIDASGTSLVYCGYVGGASVDLGRGIAVDAAGNAYATGLTGSNEATFPVTVGPERTLEGDAPDAFVVKVDPAGAGFVYAGYIGGTAQEEGRGIAVDAAGAAYVTGAAYSSEATFPVTVGPGLTFGGVVDAFVAKVAPSGARLDYAGYIGGAAYDEGTRIAVDASGNAYVVGRAESDETSFPVVGGPDLTHGGGADAFVAKVAPSGASLVFSGYLGGTGEDDALGVAVDGAGNVYVTGGTNSADGSFPALDGPDSTPNGGFDCFVTGVSADASRLLFSGFLGGSEADVCEDLARDAANNLYVTGYTTNALEFPALVGPRVPATNRDEAIVAKIGVTTGPNQPPVAKCKDVTVSAGPQCDATADVNAGSFDPDGGAITCAQTPSPPYPLGETAVTLTCTDASGLSSSCTATVTVADTTGPVVTTRTVTLAPPNHQYVDVELKDCVTSLVDACEGPLQVCDVSTIVRVTSDEPEDGPGDGDTCDDIVLVDATTVRLRAERQGGGDGRVYTVVFTAADGAGNTAESSCRVEVRKQPKAAAVDSGPAYCVGTGCGAVPGPGATCH